MEQAFENRLRFLRCTWSVDEQRVGPPHASESCVTLVVRRDGEEWVGYGRAPKSKDARRAAMRSLEEDIAEIPDPCLKTVSYERLWEALCKAVVAFRPPPDAWFEAPQTLGVDWEGQPPAIVQIAGEAGVYIDRADAAHARRILADRRHVHCVFGAHEAALVANPRDLQRGRSLSLAELASLTLAPSVRFVKDKSLHRQTNWRAADLGERALRYAALDAEVTRLVGLRER